MGRVWGGWRDKASEPRKKDVLISPKTRPRRHRYFPSDYQNLMIFAETHAQSANFEYRPEIDNISRIATISVKFQSRNGPEKSISNRLTKLKISL